MTSSADKGVEPAPGSSRVSVPPNAFYVPSPVVLLSTTDEAGCVDISTMSAVGVVCLDPPIVAVGIKARRQTYSNIRRTGWFVLNLPLEDDLWAADYLGTRPLRKVPMKVEESRLEVARLPESGLPYLPSCPVSMACRVVGNLGRRELGLDRAPSHQVVLGQLTECSVEGRWLGEDELRLEDMPLLVYLNRVYARTGANLQTQRFTDEPEKQAAKMHEYRSIRG